MELAWYALLGLFFATYLVLGGYDYGVGLLLARRTTPATRRAALTASGRSSSATRSGWWPPSASSSAPSPRWRASCSPGSIRPWSARWPG